MISIEPSTRIIKIDEDSIFLTPSFRLGWDQTNLPYASFTFKSNLSFYWEVALENFDKKSQELTIKVVNYHPVNLNVFSTQKMKRKVTKLHFQPLEWKYLESFLSSYRKEALVPVIVDSPETIQPDQTVKEYTYQAKVYFKDIRCKLGHISFFEYIPAVNEEMEIQIANSHIIPEMEFIKGYFAKRLKRKTFEANIRIKMTGYQLAEITATSPQIDRINENLIGTLKKASVFQLRSEPIIKVIDKSLFTAENVFDSFEENVAANLGTDIQDIIHILLEAGEVRNRKQIQFLAGKKQEANQKIYITLKPFFGFLFTLAGDVMIHFVWELLDSHATYIWSMQKSDSSRPNQLKRIEKIIQQVQDQGRERYKRSVPDGLHQEDIIFNSIIHRHSGSRLKDAFPEWRHNLEQLLI